MRNASSPNRIDDLLRDAHYAALVYLKTGIFSGIVSVLIRTAGELALWVVAGERSSLGFTPPAKTKGEVLRAFESRHEQLRGYLQGMANRPGMSLRLGGAALQSRREWKAALADLGCS